ncbi:MAG: SDR family NAD(P)-dependent oxidoreductase [Acidobacteriales bacterium]|nr:SDR family NAD(P)-dependent oxidoreductase [Terriglobales bacterium]
MDVRRKVVVVTGASMGIGEAIARVFASHGAKLVLAARDPNRLEAARTHLSAEVAIAVPCDVTRREDLARVLETTLSRFGHLDVWVNNAGHGLMDSVAQMDLAECRRMFETNLFAVIQAMQLVAPVMQKQGGGTIINISSVAGYIAVPYMAAYGATKRALNAITLGARMELEKSGVRVINVCPGYIATDFALNAVKGKERYRLGMAARTGITADQVAHAVLKAYLKNKREVVVPWKDRIFIVLYLLAPWIVEGMIKRMLRPADEVIAEAAARRST